MLDERSNSEFGSDISHMVEGMEDKYVNENAEQPIEHGTDQVRDMINSEVLDFNTAFPQIDITNREQMLAIQDYITRAMNRDHEAGKELLKLLNTETAKQLPAIQNQEQIDFVNEMASELAGMTGEDLDAGIEKARSAHG
ncbi:MAG TPA: hypothetical protein PKD79_01880 [Candidatus Doudnabacteria bacterium]|nr:hypothetical protein [Candidatus Doudnabacteria bacterium]